MKIFSCSRNLLLLLLMLCAYFSAQSQITYNFDAGATLSNPTFPIWNTQANITIGGVNYKLTNGGNGSFTNSPDNGSGNSKSLSKDGAGAENFILERADGQPFQFYGIYIRSKSMSNYANTPPFYTITYTKTVGAPETEVDNIPKAGGTYTTAERTYTKNLTVTQVNVFFNANANYWIDDIRVGPPVAVVDVTPPTVTSMIRSLVSPTNRTEVYFSIFFSEPVTGVDANDFAVVGLPGTVSGITALPDNRYNITVNNVSGSGTLGLNLKSSGTGIVDLAGNPISGGYTGPVYTIDQTAPAAPVVVTPANGTTVNSLTPVISGTAEINSLINIIIDGTTLTDAATANALGNWTYTPVTNLTQSSHTVSAHAVDQVGNQSLQSNTNTFTVSLAPTIVVAPATVSSAKVGVAYSETITASGGVGTHTFSISAGALPAGLSLNTSTGALSGTPTAAGTFNFTVRATDASSAPGPYSGTRPYTLTVASPTILIAQATIPNTTVAAAYSQTITASGGIAPYTYSVTAGSLPAGLTINSNTGTISGTPTAGGTFNFTVTARSSSTGTGVPHTGSSPYSLSVNAPTLTLIPASAPAATVYVPYSQTFIAGNGTAPYSYAIVGALPAGLTLSTGGVLSGTPTASGTFNFTVTGTDSSTGLGPYSVGRPYTLNVSPPTIVVAPTTVSSAKVGVAYSETITASGGVGTHTFSISAGALPAGLSLNTSTGALSGTPTAAGTFNFTVRATDASSAPGPYSGTRPYTLTVASPTILIAQATIPNTTVAAAYSQTITASGGIAPYTYSVTAGSLPAGLTINSNTGTISGTPTAGGTFNFTVTARSSSTGTGVPHTGSSPYSLSVNAPTLTLIPASVPAATAYAAYSQTFTASGGTAPYTYAITLGSLPNGLTLSTGGVLSGTPIAGGPFNFTVTGTDSSTGTGPYSKSQGYTLNVAVPIVISPATLPNMSYAVSYNQTLTSSGGLAPYTYSVTSGALPAGITLSPAGVLSGIPSSSGSFSITVKSTDANGLNISKPYNFTVSAAAMAITPATLANPVLAVAYSQTLSSSGGIAPYSYSVTSGALPDGMSLNSAGLLSGTPRSAGDFTFIVKSADNGSANTLKSYTLTIATPTLTISPASLPGVTVGDSYSQTLTTSGATAPYTYVRTTGALPPGLSLSTGGVISGTPTTKGTYSFTVRSTDSSVGSGPYNTTKDYSIVVQGKTQTLTMASTKTVNYGDTDFDPMASSNSPMPIIYTTSNPAIATIVAGKVHIVGTGLVNIFANQAGDGTYEAAVQKQQAVTINKAQLSYVANAASRVYGEVNPAFSGTVTGFKYTDNLAGSTTGTASFSTTATTASPVGSSAINGSGLTAANYAFVQAATNATRLSITPKELTIKADDQEKFAGAAIPTFTASYSGFANGESQTVVTTKPDLSTTATASSPVGTYDINASGAVAANYTIKYEKGVLTIKPGAPTDISLAAVTLYENRPSGTNAGTLSSVSPDPSATFTFTLVPGAGDTDNSLFSISANKLNTAASLNFEQKANYSVRIRSTTQYGLTFDKTLNLTIADVNEIPTLDAISNLPICYTTNLQTVPLTGITAGPEGSQTVVVSVTSTNSALFESLNVSNSGTTGSVNYRVKTDAVGTATVTVTVKDNGGTANGGVDTYSRTFVVTVNPLPILAINSDKGTTVSRGEVLLLSATGASNYVWTGNNGIVNGANSAVLQIRPTVTTTYTLTGTNSSGCSETQTFTVTVLDDLAKIKATNILTPNNDGYNDKWVIDNIDVYPDNDVKVFDKAGRIVYTKRGYDNSWDGQMNGTALNEGTYYYVIDFGQGKRKIRGYITVIRNN